MIYTQLLDIRNALYLQLFCEFFECGKHCECYYSTERKDREKKKANQELIGEVISRLDNKKYFVIYGGESLIEENLDFLKLLLTAVRKNFPKIRINLSSCSDFTTISEIESSYPKMAEVIDLIDAITYEPYTNNRETIFYHNLEELKNCKVRGE